MRVRVRLFARLHDLVGSSELSREVAAGATVATVWESLAEEWPAVAPYGSSVSAAVNAGFAPKTAPLAEGDEVAFLPPVSGG